MISRLRGLKYLPPATRLTGYPSLSNPGLDAFFYPSIAWNSSCMYPRRCYQRLSYSIARYIGASVWDQEGNIRDVISIGKLVTKNDGPEEVEQILQCNDEVW